MAGQPARHPNFFTITMRLNPKKKRTLIIASLIILAIIFFSGVSPLSITAPSPTHNILAKDLKTCDLATQLLGTFKCVSNQNNIYKSTPAETIGLWTKVIVPNLADPVIIVDRHDCGLGATEKLGLYSSQDVSAKPIEDIDGYDNRKFLKVEPNKILLFLGAGGCKFTYQLQGQETYIAYSSTEGIDELKVSGTPYCIDQRGIQALKGYEIGDGTGVVPTGKDETITVLDLAGTTFRGYEPGDGYLVPLNILMPLYQATERSYTYDNQIYVAKCDPFEKRVYLFDRKTGVDGQCYGIPGTIVVDSRVFSGTDIFCCTDAECTASAYYTEGMVCGADYKCTTTGAPGQQCSSDAVCNKQDRFQPNQDGTSNYIDSTCVGATTTTLGVCVQKITHAVCNPDDIYDNNKCCIIGSGNIPYIGDCNSNPKTCPKNSCCLAGNTENYNVVLAPEGQLCCDDDGDGVGYASGIDMQCNTNPFDDSSVLGPLAFLADAVGGGDVGILVALFIILIVVIVILKLVLG